MKKSSTIKPTNQAIKKETNEMEKARLNRQSEDQLTA